ncbi:hypothetical protein HU200_007930 [Digitaria exilis]|uniref:RING-type E3 ubiquitin transferase n=1 Tax=Digitaria exilis TaxID=1010633 RepID=A0A835FNE5_9POAL|nr:hypothetical protein HU200_007930 [Digitaria exilis]
MEVEGAGGLRPRLSSSRKRTRLSPPTRQMVFEDDGYDDAGEQQIEGITEYDPFDVYGGGDAVEGQDDEEGPPQPGGGGGDQPQQGRPPEQEDSDDDIPIMLLSRRRTVLRPVQDGDDERPLRLPRTVLRRSAVFTAPPAPQPGPSSSSSFSDSSSAVIKDATVENSGAIDCVICFLPLKPPIFQCDVGHVVCSRCSERQGQATNCHECRAPTPGGYTRCHAMERVVDAIRVPCPHAAHGCTHRPPYHGRDAHSLSCQHKPCHCPDEACVFAGSPAALAGHLAAAHSWPCTTVDMDGGGTNVFLRDGFNFITAKGTKNGRFLMFLLDVKRAPPFGRAVAALCIHPDRAATATLKLTYRGNDGCMHHMCNMHLQSSEFKVACTDLADEVPDPSSSCFQFVVPGSVREDDDGATTRVIVEIIRPPSLSTN